MHLEEYDGDALKNHEVQNITHLTQKMNNNTKLTMNQEIKMTVMKIQKLRNDACYDSACSTQIIMTTDLQSFRLFHRRSQFSMGFCNSVWFQPE